MMAFPLSIFTILVLYKYIMFDSAYVDDILSEGAPEVAKMLWMLPNNFYATGF